MGSYSELIRIPTYEERYNYLASLQRQLNIGDTVWGGDRYQNQRFYHSPQWKRMRHKIVVRDEYDMAMEGYPAGWSPIVHHINPITLEMLERGDEALFDPENLILCSRSTHNAIHMTGGLWTQGFQERSPGDMKLW